MHRKLAGFTSNLDNPPPLTEAQRAELTRLTEVSDGAMDTSDLPPLTGRFWTNAICFRDRALCQPVKRSTTVQPDADVLQWLKSKGKEYQTRLNAILREAG